MKIELWLIGKTSFDYLQEGMDIYQGRLKHYLPFELLLIPDIKNRKTLKEEQIKQKEGEEILKKLKPEDCFILLDERGKHYDSVAFSQFLQHHLQLSHKRIIFQIGGAYGFSAAVYQRADAKIALSKMTFSHQMVRLIFLEQLYRGMTILKGEPYHHL